MKGGKNLLLVVADNRESLVAGLAMISAGEAWGIVFIDDESQPGVLIMRSLVAVGHENRSHEIDELVARACQDAARRGFTVVNPAVMAKRGEA